MERDRGGERERAERELEERANDEARQWRGSSPTEDVLERALEVEPGVEQHAGEDSGALPDRGEPE
jgi:hypothetical protein